MEQQNRTGTRQSNFELLRIIAMLMIVAHHYAAFGFYAEELAFSRNKIFVDIFGMAGHVGVDLFVLISAYFMATARFRLKKLLMLMGNVWFYSLGITAVFLLTGLAAPGREVLKQAIFPLLTSCYWFASYYVLLMLFSPFLNAMTARLDRRSHGALCLLCVALCMLLPEFLHLRFADGLLPMFLTLYLCGAWCRFYVPAEKRIGRIGRQFRAGRALATGDLFPLWHQRNIHCRTARVRRAGRRGLLSV